VVRKENDYLPKVLQQNNMLSLIIFAGKSLLSHLHNICQKIDFFTSKLFSLFPFDYFFYTILHEKTSE